MHAESTMGPVAENNLDRAANLSPNERLREIVRTGKRHDPRTGYAVDYRFDAILEGWGGRVPSAFAPFFDPLRLRRVQGTGTVLLHMLDWLEEAGRRYISDGDPATVAGRPAGFVPVPSTR